MWKLHVCVFVSFKLKREFSAGVTERMDAGVSHTHTHTHTHTVKPDEQFFSQPWQSKGWILFYCACFLFTLMNKEVSLPQVTVSHGHSLLHYSYLDRTDTALRWRTSSAGSPSCSFLLTGTGFWCGSGFTWTRRLFRNLISFIRLCVWSITAVVNRPA